MAIGFCAMASCLLSILSAAGLAEPVSSLNRGPGSGHLRMSGPPTQGPAADLAMAVEQLRHAQGTWSVTTEFLNEDGSVAKVVQGTYRFTWVIPDRVAAGQSEIPELEQISGILFYVNEKKLSIEMVSVGRDGSLWTMTGAAGDEVRLSQPFRAADGKESQLRFTRYNVSPGRFESRMEYTSDGGKTWLPGNHQVFVRAPA